MNPYLKAAYDVGVQQAIEDFDMSKVAVAAAVPRFGESVKGLWEAGKGWLGAGKKMKGVTQVQGGQKVVTDVPAHMAAWDARRTAAQQAGQHLGGLGRWAAAHPGRVAAGVGAAGLGTAGLGYGAARLMNPTPPPPEAFSMHAAKNFFGMGPRQG
ncbi:hypothetical protein CMI47_20460 [Candidatus Pacearchaeota archaeon]|nr:hypothetical protein [Candidatus Pacearchaeota archaeon]|tara:strand:+ start:2036 stop:2500 length:465 start_codon:yes stop_codon:yes gene_type:complete